MSIVASKHSTLVLRLFPSQYSLFVLSNLFSWVDRLSLQLLWWMWGCKFETKPKLLTILTPKIAKRLFTPYIIIPESHKDHKNKGNYY